MSMVNITAQRIEKVSNCYDCPFWKDGAAGEYACECGANPNIEVLDFNWQDFKDDKSKQEMPKGCPLRHCAVTVVRREA
jgi:hypothetical protein